MIARLRRRLGAGLSPGYFDSLVLLGAFLTTRVLVLGSMAAAYAGWARPDPNLQDDLANHIFAGPLPPRLLLPFVHYDAYHYVGIARLGYPPAGEWSGANVAFFPLYPLMVRFLDHLVGDAFVSAMVVANVAALLATFAIYALARDAGGRRAGRAAALLLVTSPAAHFLSLGYSESTFCLLVAVGLWAIGRDRMGLAAVAGALASATRITGVVVAVGILIRAFRDRAGLGRLSSLAAASGVACSGLVVFALFCWSRYDDPLRFIAVQSGWGRQVSALGPLRALAAFSFDPDYYLMTLGAIALVCWMALRRVPVEWTAAASLLLLIPLSTGTLKSMVRFQGTNLPLLAGGGLVMRARLLSWVLAAGMALQVYEAVRFSLAYHNY